MEGSNIIFNAIASLEMENFHPSSFDRGIAIQWLKGEIDMDSAVKSIVEHYKGKI